MKDLKKLIDVLKVDSLVVSTRAFSDYVKVTPKISVAIRAKADEVGCGMYNMELGGILEKAIKEYSSEILERVREEAWKAVKEKAIREIKIMDADKKYLMEEIAKGDKNDYNRNK